MITNVR